MPYFVNKFSPKKAPPRRRDITVSKDIGKLVSGQRTVYLTFGEEEHVFENGDWVSSGLTRHSATHKAGKKLTKNIDFLKEENNLLMLKLEIIMNMLTQSTAENLKTEQKETTKQ